MSHNNITLYNGIKKMKTKTYYWLLRIILLAIVLFAIALFSASCNAPQSAVNVAFEPLIFDIKQKNTIAHNDTVRINFTESGYSVQLLETTYNSRLIIQKLDTLIQVSK